MAISPNLPCPLSPTTPRRHPTPQSLPPNSFSSYLHSLQNGDHLNAFTYPSLLKTLADHRALTHGQAIQTHIIKTGCISNIYIINHLLRLYTVCGEMGSAQKLFDHFPHRDVVSWTTLISGYAKMGFYREAVGLFLEMVETGVRVDEVIAATVFSACAKLGDLDLGRKVERYVSADQVRLDTHARNAMLNMYLKCGDVRSGYELFRKMNERSIVTWNSMINGLACNGESNEAISLFGRMQAEESELEPDGVTLVGVLNSCADLGALELGEWVHAYMDRKGIGADGIVGNALVDMYAKCGRTDRALGMFNGMDFRDVYSYTSMIACLAMNGQGGMALDLFAEMLKLGLKPNGVTCIGVLSACSHAGLVEMGIQHFKDMLRMYGVTPQIEHYGCMVDMLGRAGLLDEAVEFVNSMPIEPDAFIWGALLGACKIHGNVTLGEIITERLLELDPECDGSYVAMSNIYTSANRKRNATETRKAMEMRKVKKTPGCSLIELGGIVHEFRMGDKAHPQAREIYLMIDEISAHLRDEETRDKTF